MLHPENITDKDGLDFAEAARAYEALQASISRSNRFPFNVFATLAGVLQTLFLAAITVAARLINIQPGDVSKLLGAFYFHVPEMAIHKRVELEAYLREPLDGEGVDFGCGGGEVGGILIHKKGLVLTGLDQNSAFATSAASNGYANFHATDVATVPLPSSAYDYVISICVLEHVKDIDFVLAEARRLLKSGGKLVFSTPLPAYRDSLVGVRVRRFFGRDEAAASYARRVDARSLHVNILDTAGWAALLAGHGFELRRTEPLFSRPQHLLYDLLNWQVYFPTLYMGDKLYRVMQKFGAFRRLGILATSGAAEISMRFPANAENATHIFCVAYAAEQADPASSLPGARDQ